MNPAAAPRTLRFGLPPEQFAAAFPFHLAVDRDLVLRQAGRSLQRLCPDVTPGAVLATVFRLLRPEGEWDFAWLLKNRRELFLLVHLTSGLQLRGEFVALPGDAELLFLGSPWLTDSREIVERGLDLDDFAVHDPVVDLLNVLEGQRMALGDAKKLLAKVSSQRAELRAANERLREQEAEARKLALVAARTHNGVVLTDAAGLTIWVNEGFTRLTGYSLADMLGRKPGSVLQGPGTAAATVRDMRERLRRGEGFSAEMINYRKDGGSYWVAIEVQPIHDASGRLINFMAIEADITERKRAAAELLQAKEAAETANRAKSDFLAMMSHEIRTPMSAVIGMTGLLLETPLSAQQREFATVASRSGEALLEIINDILDFSKIEAGQLPLEMETVRLQPILDGVVALFGTRARERGLTLTADVSPEVPAVLHTDDGRLRQVLVNLVGNAIKFTVRGGVQVRVRRLAAASPRVRLRFEVEDSGAGIAVADQERLFQPFTQFGTGPERKRGGTGLGLAISRRLVELLGGRIGVRSEVGVGSVFWFELETEAEALADRAVKPPDTVPGSRPGVRPRALAAPGGATARPLRILVAEDHAVNRRLATLMLEKLGYHPGLVTNGREAVEAWERGGYDLILMDCQMPEMDGFEATREIRRRAAARPPGKPPGVKIIALTANALAGDRERCLAAGMDGYISKPVRLEQLGAALGAAALPGVSAPEPTGPPGEEKAMKAP